MQPLSVVEHIKPVLMARLVPLESQALLAAGIRGVSQEERLRAGSSQESLWLSCLCPAVLRVRTDV